MAKYILAIYAFRDRKAFACPAYVHDRNLYKLHLSIIKN